MINVPSIRWRYHWQRQNPFSFNFHAFLTIYIPYTLTKIRDILTVTRSGAEVILLLNFKKPLKNLCSSHSMLLRRYFQHLRSVCSIFAPYKAKSDTKMLFFQVYHFMHTPNSQMDHTLVLDKTYATA